MGTGSSLTLNNLVTSQAGVYTVIVNGTCSSVTNSATLTVNKATASITLGSLEPDLQWFSQIGDGNHHPERSGSDFHLQRFCHGSDQRRQLYRGRND